MTAVHSGRLQGKVALITGGAGSIGSIITRRYLEEGATVVITGRDAQKLRSHLDQLITDTGVSSERVLAVPIDGSNVEKVHSGMSEIIARLGRIDILVNNAGSAGAMQRLSDIPLSREELREGDAETLSEAIGNLLGITWNMARAAIPHMAPGSSIVNVSTIFSRTDYYGRIAYTVPKAALNALSQNLARELGARGIRVNAVYPGPVESERIRSLLEPMDALKGQPEGSTASQFLDSMSLHRVDASGALTKNFPAPLDVANAVVFLGSDESAALNGQSIEVTHGMDVPAESRTSVVSRPGLRAVDATGKVMLICAGDQIEDAMALTGVLRSCGADVAMAFRNRASVARVEQILEEGRRWQGPDYVPPLLLHLDPLEADTVQAALNLVQEYAGPPDAAIILPAHGVDTVYPPLAEADDQTVAQFLDSEIGGVVALVSQLVRFWASKNVSQYGRVLAPQIMFMSNSNDGRGNVYADILRAAVEQLMRVMRHEAQHDQQRQTEGSQSARLPIWGNQIIRYQNTEAEGLDFACAWAAKLLNSERRIDEINIYLPEQITVTTGAQRPSFGWAESLIGLHLGKTALITGGSAGIGGQVARLLALSGARVMLGARGLEQLEQLRATIVQELTDVGYNDAESRVQITANCNVANEADMALLVERTLAAFGRVDYLINNAGIAGVEEMVIDMPLDGWRYTLQANLNSNYSLIRKLAPLMKAQGSGYILNVSSYFGGEKYVSIPYPNRSDYAVSKAGQRALSEALARFMGPEVQINTLAPGPVEGDRLRGTGERPGLFMRRARLILENKRLNDVHAALIEAHRLAGTPIADLFGEILANNVEKLAAAKHLPEPLQRLAATILQQSDPQASSRAYLLNESIVQKLVSRLETGGYLPNAEKRDFKVELPANAIPGEPYFTRAQIEREARKVRDGVMSMLYLQRMPTEFDVATATVYYLADRNVTGETFHPSGGLRVERTTTEGELFGQATPERLEKLRGSTVYLIGEYLQEHLAVLTRAYLETYGAGRVVVLTETDDGANAILGRFPDHAAAKKLVALAVGNDLEGGIDRACIEFGRPGPAVCMPFRALPARQIVASGDGDWSNVLDEQEFIDLVEHSLTHYFRVTKKMALMDNVQLVLVTPETTARSTSEEFALANFIKTTLHAFTSTAGVESERNVHRVPINQVDLTRRARNEEPRSAAEEQEELARFVDAVLLTSAPLLEDDGSRYQGRIYRGKAITV
jgi:malonyl-CoA reductase/3-hydroxypropionate dehydrogenase (NADP+)